jgi:ATP adenylyltransferase/5',5'''-P-1,P-4-tetraphosphate phosphorylase II
MFRVNVCVCTLLCGSEFRRCIMSTIRRRRKKRKRHERKKKEEEEEERDEKNTSDTRQTYTIVYLHKMPLVARHS